MMFNRSAGIVAIIATTSTALVGCSLLYPRFDNPLNPDIAFLNAGDVVDSVKCAVSTFLINYRTPVEVETRAELIRELAKDSVERSHFCPRAVPFGDLEKEPREWKMAFHTVGGEKCNLDPDLILQANDEQGGRSRSITIIREGIATKTINYSDDKDLVPKLKASLPPGYSDKLVRAEQNCRSGYYHPYKYIRLEEKKRDSMGRPTGFRCQPNGGCRPGTKFSEQGRCVLEDDEGAFAIDPDNSAKIELGLTAINTGSMNYTRIDANRLDILRGIIVPGDGSKGFPFPMLKATDRKTNKVEISVAMSQGRIQEHSQKKAIDDLKKAVEAIVEEQRKKRSRQPAKRRAAPTEKGAPEVDLSTRLYPVVRADLETEAGAGEYTANCKSNLLKVNYLGLARYIENIVSEQEKSIHKGAPEVSLESIVLTSSFQINFDATAGTKHILEIVPVLVPPTLQINPDHTHQLKLTLKGYRGRRSKAKAVSAYRRCVERLEKAPGIGAAADAHCRTPFAIQLESLIEAVQDTKSGSN